MRRYLSGFKFSKEIIILSIYDCLNGTGNSKPRWTRKDTAYFLADYSIQYARMHNFNGKVDRHEVARNVHQILQVRENRVRFKRLIEFIAEELYKEIDERRIELDPIRYQLRLDSSSNKIRLIGLASIKQQVYDHIVVRVCRRMFMNKVDKYQCASIPGRGQLFGKSVIETWIRTNPKQCRWVWKGDIRKFYPSIPHDKLKELLRRDIKNDDVLYVVFYLIDTYGAIGLCIGSYLSQFLANYYLSYAFHYLNEKCFVTRRNRCTGEVKNITLTSHRIFYMDDMLLFSPNKKHLKKCVNMLEKYVNDELNLEIKAGHQLFSLDSRPIDMMGYKIYTYKTTIRKGTFCRMNRILVKCKDTDYHITIKMARSMMSYKGYLDHTNSQKYRTKMKFDRSSKRAKGVIRYENYCRVYGATA